MGNAFPTRFVSASMLLALSAAGPAAAQQQQAETTDITVNALVPADLSELERGPDVVGVITARRGERVQVTGADRARAVVHLSDGTEIRSRGGFLGVSRQTLGAADLVNGIPVTIETVQWGETLVARRVNMRTTDLRTARMIRDGTEQGFSEQTEATNALRSRVANIDQYNVRRTVNAYFDTGRWQLSPAAQAELCAAATEAQGVDNALLLVVGYTDAVGSEDYNQVLSERRAGRVAAGHPIAC
ncbi:MAG: OmpA family protein [Sphingopyxis sp.]